MRQLIINALGNLLRNIKSKLLPHMSVHKPLNNLIIQLSKQVEVSHKKKTVQKTEKTGFCDTLELLYLVKIILRRIYNDPSIANFFCYVKSEIDPTSYDPPSSLPRKIKGYIFLDVLISLFSQIDNYIPKEQSAIRENIVMCVIYIFIYFKLIFICFILK